MANTMDRGKFIVFEGSDRTGKTTQSKLLFEKLKRRGVPVKRMSFPNRETESGQMIDAYLKGIQNYSAECIHLLFSVNRWQCIKEMECDLNNGITLIVDRYSYSGVAFSVSKGLQLEWCKMSEKGLPKPDVILYFKGDIDSISLRDGFGSERYETLQIQRKVNEVYDKMMLDATDNNLWKLIVADGNIENISQEVEQIWNNLTTAGPITTLW
jgi:dTMP kinase